jgi:hypothetical protein
LIRVNAPLTVEKYLTMHGVKLGTFLTDVPETLLLPARKIINNEQAPEQDKLDFLKLLKEAKIGNNSNQTQMDAVGSALEICTYFRVKDSLEKLKMKTDVLTFDIKYQVRVKNTNPEFGDAGEIDVACVVDTRLVVFECKAGNVFKNKEKLYEAYAQLAGIRGAGHLDTDYTKCVLVSQYPPRDKEDQEAKDLGVKWYGLNKLERCLKELNEL